MKQRTKLVSWKTQEGNTQAEQQHEKRLKKYEASLREPQNNIKHNIRIIGIAEGQEKKKVIESLFEKIITENFPNLDKGKAM